MMKRLTAFSFFSSLLLCLVFVSCKNDDTPGIGPVQPFHSYTSDSILSTQLGVWHNTVLANVRNLYDNLDSTTLYWVVNNLTPHYDSLWYPCFQGVLGITELNDVSLTDSLVEALHAAHFFRIRDYSNANAALYVDTLIDDLSLDQYFSEVVADIQSIILTTPLLENVPAELNDYMADELSNLGLTPTQRLFVIAGVHVAKGSAEYWDANPPRVERQYSSSAKIVQTSGPSVVAMDFIGAMLGVVSAISDGGNWKVGLKRAAVGAAGLSFSRYIGKTYWA